MNEEIKLIDVITDINSLIQTEDAKIRDFMTESQKKYADKLKEWKEKLKDNSELSYELGRFAAAPQSYQVPPEHMPKIESEAASKLILN